MADNFIDAAIERGYVYQSTDLDALRELMSKQKISAYIGFDCTANSLHIGNLMQVMVLRLLQQYGHKPIILIGGATTKIGDPTGKDEMRKMLSDEDIARHAEGIKSCLSKYIKFGDGPSDAIMLNNSEWLEQINYIDFLRNFGRYISINRMMNMDSVKTRLERENNLTFLEFNYSIIQGYDFYHLNKHNNCMLQIGGSDQWGNILQGVELTRKASKGEVFGLTTPLFTTSSGVKMGQTVGGAVWLNEAMLSPYDFYQYWRNIEDADVKRFAKLYAEFSGPEEQEYEILADSKINEAKKLLALKLTSMCHGQEEAQKAAETARKVFEEGAISDNLPIFKVEESSLEQGIPAFEAFFQSGLCASKSEARKLVRGGGAKVNDVKLEDENKEISKSDLQKNGYIKLSAGKKRHLLIAL